MKLFFFVLFCFIKINLYSNVSPKNEDNYININSEYKVKVKTVFNTKKKYYFNLSIYKLSNKDSVKILNMIKLDSNWMDGNNAFNLFEILKNTFEENLSKKDIEEFNKLVKLKKVSTFNQVFFKEINYLNADGNIATVGSLIIIPNENIIIKEYGYVPMIKEKEKVEKWENKGRTPEK